MENLDSLLLAVFCFFSGAALVGGVIYMRGRTPKRPDADAQPNPDLVEVAALWRSRKTNRMVVGMDGETHASVRELSASQRQHLTSASTVLQSWLTEGEPSAAPMLDAPAVQPVARPVHSPASPACSWITTRGCEMPPAT